jgi:hypothetical protein
MKEFLLNLLLGTLEQLEESSLVAILQKLHDKNIDQYKAAIYGGYALVQGLKPLVVSTKTNIDDVVLEGLLKAITTSATTNGIDLTTPVSLQPTLPVPES